jgi:siroheme synthase
VTHRGIARSVVFVTGETNAASGGAGVDWAAIAAIDTIVIFMAGRSAGEVAGRLIDAGRTGSTPAAVIADATLPGQSVRRLDLATLRRHGAGHVAGRPTMLVLGNVVGLGSELAGIGFWPDPGQAEQGTTTRGERVGAGLRGFSDVRDDELAVATR